MRAANWLLAAVVGTAWGICGEATANEDSANRSKESNRKEAAQCAERASVLRGLDVENRQGERLGEIDDLIIADGSYRVSHAILGAGGFLGIGEDKLPIPFDALTFKGRCEAAGEGDDIEKVVVDLPKARVEKAPRLKSKEEWPTRISEADFQERLRGFYGVGQDDGLRGADRARPKTSSARCLVASRLIGHDVENFRDESIGEIEDLMVDLRTGYVAYAALAAGGTFGIGEKLFAVPLGAFHFQGDDQPLRARFDKERMDDAPGFDKKSWPRSIEPDWLVVVYQFHAVTPSWEDDDLSRLEKTPINLSLELRRGERMSYRVSIDRDMGRSRLGRSHDLPGSRTAAASFRGDGASAVRTGLGKQVRDESFELAIEVRDETSEDSTSLLVTLDPERRLHGLSAAVGAGGKDSASDDESARGSKASRSEFIASVDRSGRVTRLEYRSSEKNEGSESSARSESPTDGEARPDQHAKSFRSQHHVRGILECILGRGLHGTELRAGESYTMKAAAAADDAASKTDDPRDYHPRGMKKEWGVSLESVALRYEGVSDDQARFTILAEDATATASRAYREREAGGAVPASSRSSGSSSAGDRSGDRRASSGAVAATDGHERLGSAAYRRDDGLLESLSVRLTAAGKDPAAAAGASTSDAKEADGGASNTNSATRDAHARELHIRISRI